MAEAWEAGVVSVVSEQDPISTVLLAIMAAGLRVDKHHGLFFPERNIPHRSDGTCAITPRKSEFKIQTL